MSDRIEPGGIIGIFGGGQLGRMFAQAATDMGYRTHVYCPEKNCPASQVADHHTNAAYDDLAALREFANSIDGATCEFENVPVVALKTVGGAVPIRPNAEALSIGQDRAREKEFFAGVGAETAPWRPVHRIEDLKTAVEEIGMPSILKTSRFGYDGKGQARIDSSDQAAAAWEAIGGRSSEGGNEPFAVLERFVDFQCEISVIAARGQDGDVKCFDPVRNVHRNHILYTTTAPAAVPAAVADAAIWVAARAVDALDLIGLLAVEMFVTENDRVLVNEMAPRPHNSGHWTIDACETSQYQQLVRAVCGLPLGDPARHHDAEMTNILGEDMHLVPGYEADSEAHLYMYGKAEARPGRKMGHVTHLSAKT